MSLVQFQFEGLRNLESDTIHPCDSLNLVVGPNASGKSSLLEGIYLLGRGRSFRAHQATRMIQNGALALTVSGKIKEDDGEVRHLGVRLSRGRREIRVDGHKMPSSAMLMKAFPLLVIQPSGIVLLEGAPKMRRHFLDFGAFHLEPGFLDVWKRYMRALQQRNALLRAGRLRELEPWNQEMATYGIILDQARRDYIGRIEPYFQEVASRFFGVGKLLIRFDPGWDVNRSLSQALEMQVVSDHRSGYTQQGPHRGDFSVLIEQRPVRGYLSRGQMKILVYALLLAQSRLMEDRVGAAGCVLIDDVASELDGPNRAALLELLEGRSTQFFLTATEFESSLVRVAAKARIFEISKGRLTPTDQR